MGIQPWPSRIVHFHPAMQQAIPIYAGSSVVCALGNDGWRDVAYAFEMLSFLCGTNMDLFSACAAIRNHQCRNQSNINQLITFANFRCDLFLLLQNWLYFHQVPNTRFDHFYAHQE